MSFPNLQAPKLIAISTESFERADQDSLSFNVKNSGNSEYTINIQNYSKPVFITLSEAYDNGWSAYVNGKELSHFFTYSFLNGFYMNNSGSDIIIRYNGQRYLDIAWLGISVFFITLIIGIADIYFERKVVLKKFALQKLIYKLIMLGSTYINGKL